MAIITALNRIEREIGVKRCLIIDGNVTDILLDNNQKLTTLTEYLRKTLETQSYEVISWDNTHKLSGNTQYLTLDDDTSNNTLQGDEYDLEDDEDLQNHINQSQQIKAETAKDIFNLARININNKSARRFAFVINWSDYIFGNSTTTDTVEREWLTLLGQAINETSYSSTLAANENMIILITRNLSMLPVAFYQKNPDVSCITISKPDREERQQMFDKHQHLFLIKEEKDKRKQQSFIDMMEDFTNREILQLAMMSKKQPNMSFDKLFFLFKYGEKENPWEKLDYDAVKNIKDILSQRVIGQNDAIEKVEKVIKKAYMGLTGIHKASSRNAPKGVLFFVGPTGVGKTELSKALAKFLFGDEQACIRFDMSEYAQETSDQKLIGAPPGFVGFEDGGQLTNAVREKPFSIILFDEIEKAAKPNPRILDIFLQILEDGRLTDNKGETVYFSETIIIFTSNLGAAKIHPSKSKSNADIAKEFINEVKRYFNEELARPELLGRIGYNNIVPFNFIQDAEFTKKIARSKLLPIKENIREKFHLDLTFEDEITFIDFILKGADTTKGGRDIMNALNDRLLDELAVFLFDQKEDLKDLENSTLCVSIDNNKLIFTFQ